MTDALELIFGTGGAIGRDITTRGMVRLREQAQSSYIIGAHGTGKSTLLQNIILSDIARGDKAIVCLDPHADLCKAVMLRCPPREADRVIYFSPSEQRETPFGLNPFEWYEEREQSERVSAILKVFTGLWYGSFNSTPVLQLVLETLSRTLISAYPTEQTHFFHMLLMLGEDEISAEWRRKLAAYAQDNPVAARKWAEWLAEESKRPPRNKAEAQFSQRKIDMASSSNKVPHIIGDEIIQHLLCQPTSSACFRFQETLSAKKVILVNLNGLEAESKKLVGSLILTQILAMGYLREEKGDRVPLHLIADEFDLYPGAAFAELLSKARKFGIFLSLGNQSLSQVEQQTQRAAMNCANQIVFRVNAEDARILEPNFRKDATFPPDGFAHLPRYTAAVRLARRKDIQQATVTTLREQGEENEEIAEHIQEQSLQYGRPRAEVAAHIAQLAAIRKRRPELTDWTE